MRQAEKNGDGGFASCQKQTRQMFELREVLLFAFSLPLS
jgi:hypothetical protein